MELAEWRKHIDQVVADEGEWVGVADENGYPIYELACTHDFPRSHLTPESVECTVNVQPGDRVLDDLVGEKLGETDKEGRLVPASGPTRLLILAREGTRQAATITHTVAAGGLSPTTLTIHGVDLLDGLAWWPCPSVPVEWTPDKWTTQTTDESGTTYKKPRDLAQVQLTTKLDGYTVDNTALTAVRIAIQDSFDAVNKLMGWKDPHAVVEFGGTDTTPRALIRVNDDPVLDTVQETAQLAGLTIQVELWWPGDQPVTTRKDHDGKTTVDTTWKHPIQIVRVHTMQEV